MGLICRFNAPWAKLIGLVSGLASPAAERAIAEPYDKRNAETIGG
jgi:hypothetical protein